MEYTMIKLWIKIKRKRKPNLKNKSRRAKMIKKINRINKNPVQSNNPKKDNKLKRKKENSEPSHTVLIMENGKRKTDLTKTKRSLLSLEAIPT